MFDISQYEHSSIASKLGIDNHVPSEYLEHIAELDSLLASAALSWEEHCLKNSLGPAGIMISSGFRSQEVNSHLGGSNDSPHVVGYAADLVPYNNRLEEFFKWALEWARSGVKYDEVLIEGLPGSQWVHIAVKSHDGEQRMKTMRFDTSGKLVQDNLTPVTFGMSADQSRDARVTRNENEETTSMTIDWTDDEIFNMSPEEIDQIATSSQEDNQIVFLSQLSGPQESEKRCLYVMKMLIAKLSLSPAQAAGIAGNIAYMTDGTFSTYRNSDTTYGICKWDSSTRDIFNKLHYKTCLIEEATLKQQTEFLVYTMSECLITKLQKCYDENASCNLFFSQYIKKSKWSDMFYGLTPDEEKRLRKEASDRRGFASAALSIWNDYNSIDVDSAGSYVGTGQFGPRISIGDDSKIYVSDGYISPVPEDEREFSREYIEEDETSYDPELEDYYMKLYATMMGL